MKEVKVNGKVIEVEDHFNWLVNDVDGVVWVVAKRPVWLEDYKTWIPDGFGDKIGRASCRERVCQYV